MGNMILVSGNYRSPWTGENNQKIRIAKKYLRFALIPNSANTPHHFDLTVKPTPSTWDWGQNAFMRLILGHNYSFF